jgi:hypothetical protein
VDDACGDYPIDRFEPLLGGDIGIDPVQRVQRVLVGRARQFSLVDRLPLRLRVFVDRQEQPREVGSQQDETGRKSSDSQSLSEPFPHRDARASLKATIEAN